jgi:D-lactate dehydrogenase (cytochrome)/glycolate oxidase
MAIQRIAVVGAGQMGSGIAQVAAQSGLTVTLLDAVPGLAVKTHGKLGGSLQKLVEKGKITAEARQGTLDRIHPADSVEAAAGSVIEITGKIRPSMLEFMDGVAINAVEDKLKMGLDRDAAAMMVAASDDRGPAGAEDAAFMARVFTEAGATECFSTDDPVEGEAFVVARRYAIPAVEAKGSLLLEDVGVPLPRLADLVGGVAKIAAEAGLTISVIAHAGDGNTHPLIVYDACDAAMTARAHKAFGDIMDLAVGLGGTITGEHGVGRLKKPWLAGQLGPEAMELNRRIKAALDPDGILNPGAVI